MQEIVDTVEGGYYPKQDIKVLLNNLFRHAVINDYCQKNYAEFIRLSPLGKSPKDAFRKEEINALWKDYASGHEFTAYILVMIYTGIRKLNPHCCRHTCAAVLAEDGIAPATIKEILGHKNYSTTLGYTHIALQSKLDAVNTI